MNEQKILVVDDDAPMRDFLRKALEGEGVTILAAATGEDGVKQAIAYKPDLILLDLRMPAMDGVAVCKAIRTNDQTQHTPILVVTGTLSHEQVQGAMTAGADDLICKPIDVPDLCLRVRALLKWKHVTDLFERHQHYAEAVRQMNTERLRPGRPGGS